MSRLLRIDASSRSHGSYSREMADYFQKKWLEHNPEYEIVVRNLAKDPVPHIDETCITGFYTPKEQHTEEMRHATHLSDVLISELISAEALLISVPMYNFSIPSALKAWIDQIVRIGYTFAYDPKTGFAGLAGNKPVYIIAAYGAVFSTPQMSGLNFLDPYLKTLFNFLGMENVELLAVEGTTTDESAMEKTRKSSMQKIDKLIMEARNVSGQLKAS